VFRHQFTIWLLLAGASQTGECRVVTGPDGLCAFARLDPARSDLRIGTTLQVRVNGLNCGPGLACVDCANRRHRGRWRSTAPDVASVDSTGLVDAERPGKADIRLEFDNWVDAPTASMQVVVTP
jgi:Bacterial Ig-like domain (group 2)